MRTRLAPLLLAAGLAGCTCTPNAFEVVLDGQTTVNGDPASAGSVLTRIPAIGSFASINLGASEVFQQKQVTADAVQSLQVTSLDIEIVNPDTQGFDFLDELHFFAAAGSQEVEVAGKSGIAQLGLEAPHPTLSLDVSSSPDLREFLSAPSISLTARGSGRVPPQNTTLRATARLLVGLKVL